MNECNITKKFRNAMKMLKDSVPRNKKKTGMEKKSKVLYVKIEPIKGKKVNNIILTFTLFSLYYDR